MGRPDLNFWSAAVGKYCRDATALRIVARGNCREAQFDRPQVAGGAEGRCESVRTTGEVVGLVSDRQSRLECKMRSRVAIGMTTTMEMSSIMATRS